MCTALALALACLSVACSAPFTEATPSGDDASPGVSALEQRQDAAVDVAESTAPEAAPDAPDAPGPDVAAGDVEVSDEGGPADAGAGAVEASSDGASHVIEAAPPPPLCSTFTCSGCCSGDVCESGTLSSHCGGSGGTCTDCTASGGACVGGACVAGSK